MASRVECLEELIYCRLPEGWRGMAGTRPIFLSTICQREKSTYFYVVQSRDRDKGFQVDVLSPPDDIHTLTYFEVNDDNRNYFKKPINEKNKPLCKELICRQKIMKYVINDTFTMPIRTGDTMDET